MIRKIFEKCSFPTGCVYNPKPKGGSKMGGEAVICVKNKKDIQNDLIQQQLNGYIELALTRVTNA